MKRVHWRSSLAYKPLDCGFYLEEARVPKEGLDLRSKCMFKGQRDAM